MLFFPATKLNTKWVYIKIQCFVMAKGLHLFLWTGCFRENTFSFDVNIKIIRPFHPSFQNRCETSDPTNTADVWHCQCNFICMFWCWQWCSPYWKTNCKWKDQTMKVHLFLTFLTGTILLFGSDFHWERFGNYSSFTISHAFRGISYPNHAALKQASCS